MSGQRILKAGKYYVEVNYRIALEGKAVPFYIERLSTNVTIRENVDCNDFERYMKVRALDLSIRKQEWRLIDVVIGDIVPELPVTVHENRELSKNKRRQDILYRTIYHVLLIPINIHMIVQEESFDVCYITSL